MKIILTGTTGFVGTEVLLQCLASPSITSIIVLSRKQLPESLTNNPKVTVKILDDFLSYPDSLLQDLRGAEAVIWTLGIPGASDLDYYRRVNVGYTMAGVQAFTEHLIPYVKSGTPFRFLYCSGAATERDQERTLWLGSGVRKIRGQTESSLLAYQEIHPEVEIYILRPAMIVSPTWRILGLVFGVGLSIRVERLAGVMVDVAQFGTANGNGVEGRVLENSIMNVWGLNESS
ncbi:hypothetical protein BDW59DRAFT_162650 [Aspergillus cavernicola]|uniref:NAD(P)-binding domain-containing protein n=1 Tax=Aspergillus cavernicola TaxID=176166 RepID=A0ABR4I9H7_9EURO